MEWCNILVAGAWTPIFSLSFISFHNAAGEGRANTWVLQDMWPFQNVFHAASQGSVAHVQKVLSALFRIHGLIDAHD